MIGLIDTAGNMILEPIYSQIFNVHPSGLAAVAIDENGTTRAGVVDISTGQTVVPFEYEITRVLGGINRLVAVTNDSVWGFSNNWGLLSLNTNTMLVPKR